MAMQREMWPSNWDPLEIAYFAGLFDGEGTLGIYKYSRAHGALSRLAIFNNDVRPLKRVKELFGGGLYLRIRPYKTVISRNWAWYLDGRKAERFLRAILPHLIIKKDKAEAFLAARSMMPGTGGRWNPENREAFHHAIHDLRMIGRA